MSGELDVAGSMAGRLAWSLRSFEGVLFREARTCCAAPHNLATLKDRQFTRIGAPLPFFPVDCARPNPRPHSGLGMSDVYTLKLCAARIDFRRDGRTGGCALVSATR